MSEISKLSLTALHIKRGGFKQRLTDMEKFLNDLESNINDLSKEVIEATSLKLSRLEDQFTYYESLQDEIEQKTDQLDDEFQERSVIESRYDNVASCARSIIKQSEVRSVTSKVAPPTSRNINLPSFQLAPFDGDYTQWRSFFDGFNAIIHNDNRLSDVERLCYLKTVLRGDALNTIKSLDTTATNYKIAYETLREKFSNNRQIAYSHVNALLNVKANNLKNFVNTIEVNLNCLKSLKIDTSSWDAILLPLLMSKLDSSLVHEWNINISSKMKRDEIPTIFQFITFLSERSDAFLDSLTNKNQKSKSLGNILTTMSASNANQCPLCKFNHALYQCKRFLNKSISDRCKFIQSIKACFNCLKIGHTSNQCTSSNCKNCNLKHNTLLHRNNDEKTIHKSQSSIAESAEPVVNCVAGLKRNKETLLGTAEVFIYDNQGHKHKIRILLDPAAQDNFITESLVHKLKLIKHKNNFPVTGFNQSLSHLNSCVTAKLKSMNVNHEFSLSCIVTPSITAELPRVSFKKNNPNNFSLADKEFNISRGIDLLINATETWKLVLFETASFDDNLTLLKTKLGWVVIGDVPLDEPSSQVALTTITLNDQLQRFWTLENFDEKTVHYTEDETKCEELFCKTTYRDKSGRFVVSIPLRENFSLGNSRNQAAKRFMTLERKLQQNLYVKEMYSSFMKEYEELGHMSEVTYNNETPNQYFLPHHHVIREDSATTKLRVVFDGSCITDNNQSLNNIQLVGPTMQNDLFSILIKFRKHSFIATADIKQMYRQIKINKNQRNLQQIVWRYDPKNELKTYQLNTVTYGTASAPYLAIRCLFELANQNNKEYPLESAIIKNDFYVDDLLTGADSLETLNSLCINIRKILASAGFMLHKWTSNSKQFTLNSSYSNEIIQINNDCLTKTLGIIYMPDTDSFAYRFNKSKKLTRLTKRTILSATAETFDPIGILTPLTIVPKIIIQKLWQLQLDWDQEIPQEIADMWNEYYENLHTVNELNIPRQIINSNCLEIHGFSDASEKAYGACIYLKSICSNGVTINLVTAKSRVAPLKQVSLPRLELCAALLLAELMDRVLRILELKLEKIFLWTDSIITLSWINGHPSKWHTFVANRVSKIQQLTHQNQWYHVRSRDNPADLISRGLNPKKVNDCSLWWKGPLWLSHEVSFNPFDNIKTLNIPEQRQNSTVLTTSIKFDIVSKFSSLPKLINVIAYVRRFIYNTRNTDKIKGSLEITERKNSLHNIIKVVQHQEFSSEINDLMKKSTIKKQSAILALDPFLDNDGILRVGGRLRNSSFQFDVKHQIILPKNHVLTKLIASHEHAVNMHCGQLHLLNILRQKFWPIQGKRLAKQIIHKCIVCFKSKPRTCSEIMGDLPACRVQPAPAFLNSGVDYAGPFYTRDRRARGYKKYKSYICLFICLVTKAIHLELVSDLSTDAFLATLRRFIARRGVPNSIMSDNGTNFIGANNELKALYNLMNDKSEFITNILANEGKPIAWRFIPARSPHFGGIWESNVKLVKIHLSKVIGEQILTFEEFSTILNQIEAIINSRPLSPLSNDPHDLLPLTPGHFLIGRPLTAIPESDFADVPDNRLSTYQRMQQFVQHFWKRWKRDYIHTLQSRGKWKTSGNFQLKEGLLVLLVDDNDPPATWKMGRITKLWPGADKKVRVVSVKTKSAEVKRSVNKICILPIDN